MAVLNPDAVIDFEDETAAVIRHDARNLPLDDGTVDLIVTSPPYFALRSYRDDGKHFDGQIGSEDTPDEWLGNLDECMVEWGRVLKPSGSVWINLGDKYVSAQGGRQSAAGLLPHEASWNDANPRERPDLPNPPGSWSTRDATTSQLMGRESGYRPKSLMGLPWRFAIRQIDNGWILRAEVVWDKPNSLPESVTDRVRRSHEQWFHMVKEPRYFSGVDEIREPHARDWIDEDVGYRAGTKKSQNSEGTGLSSSAFINPPNPLGRLPGSVWTIPSEPLIIPDDTRKLLDLPDHFAAFPQEFPRRIILGWSPNGICTVCGEGRRPVVDVDWSKVPHEMVEKPVRDVSVSASFRDEYGEWCEANSVSSRMLDEATGTFMGHHWSRHPTQPAIPTPDYWATLRVAGYAPEHLDHYIGANELVPSSGHMGGNVEDGLLTTHRTGVTLNSDEAPPKTVTGYACACPTPDAPTTPAVILDPMGGTGTVAGVARTLGRYGISNDLSADYNKLAQWRIWQSSHFTKTEQRTWADRQGSLL